MAVAAPPMKRAARTTRDPMMNRVEMYHVDFRSASAQLPQSAYFPSRQF